MHILGSQPSKGRRLGITCTTYLCSPCGKGRKRMTRTVFHFYGYCNVQKVHNIYISMYTELFCKRQITCISKMQTFTPRLYPIPGLFKIIELKDPLITSSFFQIYISLLVMIHVPFANITEYLQYMMKYGTFSSVKSLSYFVH